MRFKKKKEIESIWKQQKRVDPLGASVSKQQKNHPDILTKFWCRRSIMCTQRKGSSWPSLTNKMNGGIHAGRQLPTKTEEKCTSHDPTPTEATSFALASVDVIALMPPVNRKQHRFNFLFKTQQLALENFYSSEEKHVIFYSDSQCRERLAGFLS